jgi:predicted phosphodiesterase
MKIGLISDIHSNWPALEAVLVDAEKQGIDQLICLGDIIGYGPDPGKCWEILKRKSLIIIRGNHEDSVNDLEKAESYLNDSAFAGIKYSWLNLRPNDLREIGALPITQVIPQFNMALAHGSFVANSCWQYIYSFNIDKIKHELDNLPVAICCLGHTHIPYVFGSQHGLYSNLTNKLTLDLDQKHLINPGSVGQPRDGNPQASYGILEILNNKVSFVVRRIAYDLELANELFEKAGLPATLALRLFIGN